MEPAEERPSRVLRLELVSQEVAEHLKLIYGADLDALLRCLATPPRCTTLRVNTLQVRPQDAVERLRKALEKLDADKAQVLIRKGARFSEKTQLLSDEDTRSQPLELAQSTRRWRVQLHPTLFDLILVTPDVESTPSLKRKQHSIVVDAPCGEAVLRGADVFAPGVLGCSHAVEQGTSVSVFAAPEGNITRGFAGPFDYSALIHVGNGIARYPRTVLLSSEGTGVGITMTECPYRHPALSGVLPELLFPQNLPSVVVSHLLAPKPGDTVLDMCAAPGGKTSHLAMLMQDKGILWALDKNAAKVANITSLCQRFDLKCVRAAKFDAVKALATEKTGAGADFTPPFTRESFDHILLDGPCSGLGQRPKFKEKQSWKAILDCADYQRALLRTAYALLKPGGRLAYSTCTLTVEENENNVAWFLDFARNMRLLSSPPHLQFGSRGLSKPISMLPSSLAEKCQRFNPRAALDTIGFFIAVFQKDGV